MSENPYQSLAPPDKNRSPSPANQRPQDSYILAYSSNAKKLWAVVACIGFVSAAMFIADLLAGHEFKAPPKWRFGTLLLLPIGVGLWASFMQVVSVTPGRIESRHFFFRRELDRETCRIQKVTSVGFWITDGANRTKIWIHKMMGPDLERLWRECAPPETKF